MERLRSPDELRARGVAREDILMVAGLAGMDTVRLAASWAEDDERVHRQVSGQAEL